MEYGLLGFDDIEIKEIKIIRLIEVFLEYDDDEICDEIRRRFDKSAYFDKNIEDFVYNKYWALLLSKKKLTCILELCYTVEMNDSVEDEYNTAEDFVFSEISSYFKYFNVVKKDIRKPDLSNISSIDLIKDLLGKDDSDDSQKELFERHFDRLFKACRDITEQRATKERKNIYAYKVWANILAKGKLFTLLESFDSRGAAGEVESEENFAERYLYSIFRTISIDIMKEENENFFIPKKKTCDTNPDGSDDDYTVIRINGEEKSVIPNFDLAEERQGKPKIRMVNFESVQDSDKYDSEVKQNPEIYKNRIEQTLKARSYARVTELIDTIISELLLFTAKKRVPTWLLYLVGYQFISKDDLRWIGFLNDWTVREIETVIDKMIENHGTKIYYVAIDDVADLMHERSNTITKRIRRVINDELPRINRIRRLIEEEQINISIDERRDCQ